MQTLKRKWANRSTVKKILLITGFLFVLVFAFSSALNFKQPVEAFTGQTVQTNWCYAGTTTCNHAFNTSVTLGNTLIVAISSGTNGGSIGTPTVSDSACSSWTLIVSTNNAPALHGSATAAAYYCVVTTGGADTVTVSSASASGITAVFQELLGSIIPTGTVGQESYPSNTFSVTGGNSLTSLGCEGNGGGTTFTWIGQYPAPNLQGVGMSAYGSGSVPAGTNCGVGAYVTVSTTAGGYATSTSVYSVTWVNSTCIVPTICTQTTTSTTVSYDATSTVITIIQCDGSPNCASRTQAENITVTYTDTSVFGTTITHTATVTNTALNAPTGNQLQFWLVPLIFLLGPAFGLMGGYGATVRERGGNPAATIAALMFMLGLNLGALGGIILKIMPFPVLVLTLIPLCLLLYSMR